MSMNTLSPAALSAALRGGTEEWGIRASASHHVLYMEPVAPRSRRRCQCGCKSRATHRGMANGITLIQGCEWSMRRWVRGGFA